MDILLVAMLALVTGALVYLFNQQRHYQKVDDGALMAQEDAERKAALRVERLEGLLARLVNEEQRRREETAAALSEVRAAAFNLRQEIDALQQTAQPAAAAGFMVPQSAIGPEPAEERLDEPAETESYVVEYQSLRAERARHEPAPRSLPQEGPAALASRLIEQGMDKQAVARQLGLSSHAVELISALRAQKTA